MVGWGCSAVYCATPILTKSFHFGIPLWVTRLYTIHPRPHLVHTFKATKEEQKRGELKSSPNQIVSTIKLYRQVHDDVEWAPLVSQEVSFVFRPLSFVPGKWACGLYIVLQETVSVPDKLFLAIRNWTEKRTERPAHESIACHSWELASPISFTSYHHTLDPLLSSDNLTPNVENVLSPPLTRID